MSGEVNKNPIQILTDICGQYRQIAESMKVPDPDPLENDIPEIYENAASLLTTLITCKAGFDPNVNILQEASQYEANLISLERSFVKKMEESMNQLAVKVEESQEKYNRLSNLVESSLKEIPGYFEKALASVEQKNAKRLEKLEEELNQQLEEHAKEENNLKDNFDKELQDHIEKVEKEWEQKLKDADAEVAEMQKQLHLAIHSKQEQNQAKIEELRNLEHANAAEIENETKIMNSLKNDEQEVINKLTQQLEELNAAANEENEKAKRQNDELEARMLEEKKILTEANTKELSIYENELRGLNKQLTDLQSEYEQRKAQANLRMRETEESYDAQLHKEKETTEKEINELNERLKEEYLPQIEMLNARIMKAEKQRGLSIEELHRASLENTESSENKIIELNKKHQEERTTLRAAIRKEKQQLQLLLNSRSADIEELKRNLENKIAEAQKNYDETEKTHEENIQALMEDFTKTQMEYKEDTANRIAEKEKKRAEELVRLKNEHNLRTQEIIFRIEQKSKMESENAFNSGVKDAMAQHQQEVSVIKSRIIDYNNQIETMTQRMKIMESNHSAKLKEIEASKMNDLNSQLDVLKTDFEKEKLELAKTKRALLIELKKLAKKKEMIDQQINQVKSAFAELHGADTPLSSPLDILRQSLSQVIVQMKHQEADLIIEKQSIEKQILIFAKSVEEITEQADRKQEELNLFVRTRQERMNTFMDSISKNLQTAFDEAKAKPIEFENSRIPLRQKIDDEIADMQKSLLQQRKDAEEESVAMIKERDDKLVDLENDLQKEFEEKMETMKKNHEEQMKKMKKELDDLRKGHAENMMEIQKKYEADLATAEDAHSQKVQAFMDEKKNLLLQEKSLYDKLEETGIPQCTDCNSRKETINRLTSRRNDLLDRMDELTTASIQNEQKVTAMFPKRVNAKSSLTHTQPLNATNTSNTTTPRSGRLAKPRAVSSVRKAIITPH